MKSSNSLARLGALSVFMAVSTPSWAVDPASWTCETCPYDKQTVTQGQVDVGVGTVSERNARFADFSGMDKKGAFGVWGGSYKWISEEGWFASLLGQDLGLASRSGSAEWGLQGKGALKLGYNAIPRSMAFDTVSPFLGLGTNNLTLPAGFPAASTSSMPLDATLKSAELGIKRAQWDLGALYNVDEHFSVRVDTRHDTREGTQRTAGSFFANTSQLVLPIDQVSDQFEVVGRYFSKTLQVSLAYQASLFRNGDASLTWQNPFNPIVAGATLGRLALSPNNEFHQTLVSLGYQLHPALRLSADVASGTMTQDAAFVAVTTNPNLSVPALPSSSLHGSAHTLNASLRLAAQPSADSRLTVVATRDDRNNQTPVGLFPSITTDMWVGNATLNTPYSFRQDRLKVLGETRFWKAWSLQAAAEAEETTRTLQEVSTTRESKVWAKLHAPLSDLGTGSLKALHATRFGSKYEVLANWAPAENPLMRKFNLADRIRDAAQLRSDFPVTEAVNVGFSVDASADNYNNSPLGLRSGQSVNLAADLAWSVSDNTSVHAFANEEKVRSVQVGSAAYSFADWTGRSRDVVDVVGLGVQHMMMGGKLKLKGDWVTSRGRTTQSVEPNGVTTPGFPTAWSAVDAFKFQAIYQLQDNLSLITHAWVEKYSAQDWHLDGVWPSTVPNLLALGQQSPAANVKAIAASLRFRF